MQLQREKSVITTLIIYPELFHSAMLSLDYFRNIKDTAAVVFELIEERQEINLQIISNRVNSDLTGWLKYVDSENLADNVEFIRESADQNKLLLMCADIHRAIKYNDKDSAELADMIRDTIKNIGKPPREVDSLASMAKEVEAYLKADESKTNKLKSGFDKLDTMMPLEPGSLVYMAARPGMGKTAVALQIASGVNRLYDNAGVYFACLEMKKVKLALRIMQQETGVKPNLNNPKTQNWLINALDRTNYFVDWPTSFQDFKRKARHLRYKHEIKLIVLDYVQLATTDEFDVEKLSRELKLLAMELDMPILALSQLSREVEKRKDKRPINSDLRNSGALEQDADGILMIFRACIYSGDRNDRSMEIIVTKHRDGPTGTVEGNFLEKITKFVESGNQLIIYDNDENYFPEEEDVNLPF